MLILLLIPVAGLAAVEWFAATPAARARVLPAAVPWAVLGVAGGLVIGMLQRFVLGEPFSDPLVWSTPVQALLTAPLFLAGGLWAESRGRDAFAWDREPPGRQASVILGGVLICMLLTGLLIVTTGARPNPEFQELIEQRLTEHGAAFRYTLLSMAALAGPLEEGLFRLYLLHRLAHAWRDRPRGEAMAVFVTSAVFAVLHQGMIDPEWVKYVQVFGLGLFFSGLALRFGLPAAAVAHSLFNVLAFALGAAAPE